MRSIPNKMNRYICICNNKWFLAQIWFGECTLWFSKVKNLCGLFWIFNLIYINWICHTKSESDFFLCTKLSFEYVMNSQRLLRSQKAGVKFSFKAFLYIYKVSYMWLLTAWKAYAIPAANTPTKRNINSAAPEK